MSEWISTESKLPAYGISVLVLRCDSEQFIGRRQEIGPCCPAHAEFSIQGDARSWNITHWMPLPDPPKPAGPFSKYSEWDGNPVISFNERARFVLEKTKIDGVEKLCCWLNKLWPK